LLHKHDPSLKCNKSDANCLLKYVSDNISDFDFKKDVKRLKKELIKLQQIARHIQPSTSTLRNYMVSFTGIFKQYWINRGETGRTGLHVESV
jgi:hypothetical protein